MLQQFGVDDVWDSGPQGTCNTKWGWSPSVSGVGHLPSKPSGHMSPVSWEKRPTVGPVLQTKPGGRRSRGPWNKMASFK